MTGILIKRRYLDIDTDTGRMPCKEKCRDPGDVSIYQGSPKIARKLPETERHVTNSPSASSEETNSVNTSIADF